MVLIIPQMVASVVMFYQNFDGYAQNLLNMLKELDAETSGVDLSLAVTAVENLNASMSDLLGTIVKAITNRVPQIISYVGGVASGVVTIFTAIASSVYLLLQKDKLLRHARVLTRAFLPKSAAETTLRICHDANRNFGGFFAGKILDSAIIGVLTFVSMNILGLSYATLISIIVGITNIIPVFGPFIGAIPGAVILLFLDPWQALIFLILILIIQQLDGNFIGPMILGDSIGISALWVLFAIVVGGDLFGLVGMVVGVPIFATIYGILRTAARHGLRQKGYTDVEESVSASAAGDEIPDDPRESGHRMCSVTVTGAHAGENHVHRQEKEQVSTRGSAMASPFLRNFYLLKGDTRHDTRSPALFTRRFSSAGSRFRRSTLEAHPETCKKAD